MLAARTSSKEQWGPCSGVGARAAADISRWLSLSWEGTISSECVLCDTALLLPVHRF